MNQDKKMTDVPRILIVDDVKANRFVLKNIIADMGFEPVLAENGVQALKLQPVCNPQLILLDISMPEMDGYEFCSIMKNNPATRDIPIIFISAFDEPQDIIKGFNLGGEDYITKPFIPEVVKARVGVHLKLSEANKAMMENNRRLQALISEQLKQIEQEKKNVLYALAHVARENSCYEDGHMERLSYNCKILSQAMQLSPLYEHIISDTYVETIELAAPLCDVGNVAIPMEILMKDEQLDKGEREMMQKHTVIGSKLLKDIRTSGDYNDFIQMSVDVAYYHHENWDGSGYPCGLAGDDIPLSAQIVALVSCYCALTEKRLYREAYSRADALAELEREAGIKFNPDIFKIYSKISRQLHYLNRPFARESAWDSVPAA